MKYCVIRPNGTVLSRHKTLALAEKEKAWASSRFKQEYRIEKHDNK